MMNLKHELKMNLKIFCKKIVHTDKKSKTLFHVSKE